MVFIKPVGSGLSGLGNKTYSIGPCLLIPLPIIPVFGIEDPSYDGPIKINIAAFQVKDAYKLVKAELQAIA